MKKIIIGILIVFSIFLIGCAEKEVSLDSFAQCLTDSGVKMYGAEWCSHCKNQKALFEDSFQYIDYTDCDADTDACVTAGVQGYPTWAINEGLYPGEQTLSQLAALAKCEV